MGHRLTPGCSGDKQPNLHQRFALFAAALSALALVGWWQGVPRLASFIADRPAMTPMTALAVLLAAFALSMVRSHRLTSFCLSTAQLVGGLVIVMAQTFQAPRLLGLPAHWWSSAPTGVGLVVTGVVTGLLFFKRLLPAQVLAFITLFLAALFGLAHMFPKAGLYKHLAGAGVAIPTVMAFVALSLGQLLSFPESGASAALSRRSSSGRAGLRLLLVGAIAASITTGVVLVLFRRGVLDAETAVLLVAWTDTVLLSLSLWGLALAVHRAELARQAAEAERVQLNQLVAAAVTHDLRSPLQTATLSAQVLQRVVAEPRAATAIDRLQRSHRRLDRLVRSLLDSLAFGSGNQLALQANARVALEGIVREVIGENEVALQDRVTIDGHAQGWWDSEALFRGIENLILNAVKYGEPGAPVHCGLSLISEDRVALTVTNQGPPIPQSEWETIFLPFSRSQATRGAQQVGWGIGLTYARSVVLSHGGSVRVRESGPLGTTFEIILPVDARPFLQQAQTP